MKTKVVVAIALLIIGSSGAGYFVGVSNQGSATSVSSTTTSYGNRLILYPLSILNASWVNSYTGESGSCSTSNLPFNPFVKPYKEGPPEAQCGVTIAPSQSGTITLYVSNSGNETGFAFDTSSSDPYNVFFVNSQGCMAFDAVGFCGFVEGNSSTSFQLTFDSTYSPP